MKASTLALWLTLALGAVIGVLTLLPTSSLPDVPGNDKFYHIVAFAALAVPIAAMVPQWLPVAFFIFVAYGGIIEIIQPYVGRIGDYTDWLADLAGITVGSIFGLAVNFVAMHAKQDEQ